MNGRRVLAAFLASVLCSGLFTWVLSKRLAKPATVVAAAPMRQIVAVTKNAQAGEPLELSHLETVNWPASQPILGAFVKPGEVAGRVLLFPLSAGEPVLEHDLALPGSGGGLMAKIPDGMRAMSVRADEAGDVSGFVTPGSSVDVLVTYRADSGSGFVSDTVLQNVQVLAIGATTEPDPDTKPSAAGTVTLLVTPEDALKLAQASSLGRIVLVLRNGADHSVSAEAASFGPPPGAAPSAPAPPAAPRPERTKAAAPSPSTGFTVETIAGNKATIETFAGGRP